MLKCLLMALSICVAVPASAQTQPNNCTATKEEMASILQTKHGEVPVFLGNNRRGIIMIWINRKNKTWSAVLTYKDSGVSCIVSQGDGAILREWPPEGEPA